MDSQQQQERSGKSAPPKKVLPVTEYRAGGAEYWTGRHSVRPA
ncbi:MAG: hypothetical protein ACPGQS_08810 [Bradymonadia bacterium]